MWSQFFLENVHFALNLFVALIFFAIFWLYFDAWIERKPIREIPKIIGFLLLSISFVVHATFVETSFVSASRFGGSLLELLLNFTRIGGYFFIIVGLVLDPLQPHPHHKEEAKEKQAKINYFAPATLILPASFAGLLGQLSILYPILCVIIAFLYLRRATLGLEDHIKKVALGFFLLSFSELLALGFLLQNTNNIDVVKIVVPFGPVWIAQHLILFLAILLLRVWVFGYLFKRLQTQLFMIFTITILGIFLLTTVTFTGLLLKNLQDETLKKLETDVQVLNFTIQSKTSENLSDAQVVSQNPQIQSAIEEENKNQLSNLTEDFLLTKKESSLVVVNDAGQVIARGEDRDRKGDSLSSEPLVRNALMGKESSSVVSVEGPLAPIVQVKSATPVKVEDKIIGAVITGSAIDNAFVDGIKNATGLATSVYGDNQLSATSLVSPDGKTRLIGIKEENSYIKNKVLTAGQNHSGAVEILNTPYFAAYLPLKDVDNVPVGMLFVGREQIGVLQAATKSIELTFVATVILLVLSIFPSYIITKYLTGQIH